MDYFLQEIDLTKKMFELEKILTFQLEHDVQIIRGSDYMYHCYIDKDAYGTALTPIGALVFGINQFKKL